MIERTYSDDLQDLLQPVTCNVLAHVKIERHTRGSTMQIKCIDTDNEIYMEKVHEAYVRQDHIYGRKIIVVC